MARGYKDYISSSDKQEVVIRPTLVSTTGRVLFYDNFDYPKLAWYENGHAGEVVKVDVDNYYSNGSCLSLVPVAGANKTSSILRRVPVVESQKVGIECVFCMAQNFVGKFRIVLATKYSGVARDACLQYDHSDGKWYVYSAAAWYEIPNSAMTLTAYEKGYIRLKLIVDFSTQEYFSLIVNQHYFNLAGVPADSPTSTTTEQMVVALYNINPAAGSNIELWVDNFILTEEE